jgi:hypothetical protein
MNRDTVIITYINNYNPDSKIGIWSHANISNIQLSRERKDLPHIDLKRRKVSDIIDNDRPEEKWFKGELLGLIKRDTQCR